LWEEIRAVIQEKTRTAAAEWKRMHDLQALVAADKALAFVGALLSAAREVIKDKDLLRELQEKTLRFLPPPDEMTAVTPL